MKIKLLTSIAGAHQSDLPGDIIDKPDDVASAWIKEGLAIEAPEQEIAAARVAELSKALDGVTAEREGLVKQAADLAGKLASAVKEKAGAVAEAEVHRKAADAARTQRDAVVETFEKYKVAASMRLKSVEDERDELERQAEALAEQLSTKLAELAEQPATKPTDPAS
jgi:chromosome segregation ATPase